MSLGAGLGELIVEDAHMYRHRQTHVHVLRISKIRNFKGTPSLHMYYLASASVHVV